MDRFEIEKLRSLPIEGVAERLGLEVKKHKALCPFHADHHPSLTFNVSKGTYRCYSCQAHGGVIDLAMEILHKPFYETCQWLANENNIILSEYRPPVVKEDKPPQIDLEYQKRLIAQPVLNYEARNFLFNERRLHPAVVKWLGLSSISTSVPMQTSKQGSWYNGPALLIPYRNIDGELMFIQSRYLGTADKPRFKFPRGTRCHVFNLPVLKMLREDEDLWLAEGPSDTMALLSSGRKAIGIPSATLLKRNDFKAIEEMKRKGWQGSLHTYPDNDSGAGEQLYEQLVTLCNDIGICLIRHTLPDGCKDFGDKWRKGL